MARKPKVREPSPDVSADEILTDPIDTTNPYDVLSLDKTATQDQIKSAYRKAALKHHPDKASIGHKAEANKKFQEVATAYAILSDEKRRRRYDTTGNTSETLEDDDFDLADFFRAQSEAVVNGDMIEQIKQEYQGSEEEREDVLHAYEEGKGNLDLVYEKVMCSNVIEDDKRFRSYIDEAIKHDKVEKYRDYTHESKKVRRMRIVTAKSEANEAMEMAKEMGVEEKLFGKSTTKSGDSEDALKAIIQQRQKDKFAMSIELMEARYAGKETKLKADDEPPDELFQKNAKKTKSKTSDEPSEELFQKNAKKVKRKANDEPPEELFQKNAKKTKGKR